MRKIIAGAAVLALLAGMLTGCGSGGTASNDYIEISQYDGLEINKVDNGKITEKDVDGRIKSQMESLSTNKTEVPDRPIEKGDTIILNCSAKDKDGKVLSGTELKDYELKIGSGAFIPGWEDACIGQPYGKKFTFDLKFPEGYGSDEISGKNATWTVKAKSRVIGKNAAELNDETVQKLSDTAKTVDEYRKEVKKSMTKEQESSNRMMLEQEVWEALLKQTKVKKYPKDRLQKIIDSYTDQYKEMAKQYNMPYESFLAQNGLTKETLNQQIEDQAKQDLKQQLITELLLKKLHLKMSDDDYTAKYKELSQLYGYGENHDQFVKAVGKDKAKLLAEKAAVTDWLIKHAKQVEPKKDEGQDATQQEDKAAGDGQK